MSHQKSVMFATLRGDGALNGEVPADAQGTLLLLTNMEDGNPRTESHQQPIARSGTAGQSTE